MGDLIAAARRVNAQLVVRRPISDGDMRLLANLAQVQAEAGELAGAVQGVLGFNPRKGKTHMPQDVVNEAIDVALSALVLAEDLLAREGLPLHHVLGARLAFLAERARRSGAPDVAAVSHAAR